ncbi:hypothetical protein BG011_009888 [Mortierella polycephala]|uniref:Something about silencing protein 4 domain-containing protein n=1 Tax=Mortierella polycephala TaxID=41804 RepID=A0A9P6QA53_9FUNG|nr:hypothetical protein BG011_009888 [Mortierella polycephala]
MPVPATHSLHPSELESLPLTASPLSAASLASTTAQHIQSSLTSSSQHHQVLNAALLEEILPTNLSNAATTITLSAPVPIELSSSSSNSSSSSSLKNSQGTIRTMKTDRKVNPHSAPISALHHATSHDNKNGLNNDYISNSISKKRKASVTERHVSSMEGATDSTVSEQNADAHSGNMKRRRALDSTSPGHIHHAAKADNHTVGDEDADVDVVNVDYEMPVKLKSRTMNTISSSTKGPASHDHATRKIDSKKRVKSTVHITPASTCSPEENAELSNHHVEKLDDSNAIGSDIGNGDTKGLKSPRRPSHTSKFAVETHTTTSGTTASAAIVAAEAGLLPNTGELKVTAPKTGRSRNAPQGSHAVSSTMSPAATSQLSALEPSLQKRVLPSRRGMLRDKSVRPIEASLLEPPLVPAGEYILYLGNKEALEKTTSDPKRIPPAAYGGGGEESYNSHSTSSAPSSTLSAAPLSLVTHIEVPIFKPCTISQFLQEEKKRKMQILTKALAKAEAQAAAEAAAAAAANTKPTASTLTSRPVATRLKQREIVNNQQVCVQTAAPSSSSSSSAGHSKRALTTSTTLGKIEGIGSHAAQEEILTDEVYEKRHRKQEMAEKKVKNREKEKLRHAMYQQQLVVEKLRHIEINRLMPISAFRTMQKTEQQQHKDAGSVAVEDTNLSMQHHQQQQQQQHPQQQQQTPVSLAVARAMQDEYHRRLLREAEENLRRYEQLGLGETTQATIAPAYTPYSRTTNRLATVMVPSTTATEEQDRKEKHRHSETTSFSSRSSAGDTVRNRKKTKITESTIAEDHKDASHSVVRQQKKPISVSTAPTNPSASTPRKQSSPKPSKLPEEPSRPPKPITTFIKPGSNLASGARKSSRVALAFGEKVPMLPRIDFDLPVNMFADLIKERYGEEELLTFQKQGQTGMPQKQVVAAVPDVVAMAGVKIEEKESAASESLSTPSTCMPSSASASSSSSSSSFISSTSQLSSAS